ncbi:MAG: serine protease [Chloroflexi bacterium]|nr:serine protease [Chloroflexota bacterium]
MPKIIILFFLLAALLTPPPAAGAIPADFPIASGHFYSQASGSSNPSMGFSITDDEDTPLWTWFKRLGGVPYLGYPSSRRFSLDGFTSQATQKFILQWRPEVSQVWLVNVFDLFHQRGLDDWLSKLRYIPPAPADASEAGLSWEDIKLHRWQLLDSNEAIKDRYWSDVDPLAHFGLPVSYKDVGIALVLRAQRAVFQQWKADVPWARAGQVTIANGGDLAKEIGIVPLEAAVAERAPVNTSPPQLAMVDAISMVRPAVVKVRSMGHAFLSGRAITLASGSGVIFDQRGYVLTNNHVVEDAEELVVELPDGRTLNGRLVGSDRRSDLAVIAVTAQSLPAALLGDSAFLVLSEPVAALGYSPVLPDALDITTGRITGVERQIWSSGGLLYDLLQTDAGLYPGFSGGPLINEWAEVIGIDTAVLTRRGSPDPSMGLAIAVDSAKPIIEELLAYGRVRRPWIGIGYRQINPLTAGAEGLPVGKGLHIERVEDGSPAAQAGLQGGHSITSFDGRRVEEIVDLVKALDRHRVGDEISIGVVKPDGSSATFSVVLGEVPPQYR